MTPEGRLNRIRNAAGRAQMTDRLLRAELRQGREEGRTLRELAAASGFSVEGVRGVVGPRLRQR